MTFALPTICTMLVAAAFLLLERLSPGRELPHASGWYAGAVLINGAQAVITFGTNRFGTYRDADQFAGRCGFPRHNERQLGRMLLFRDVYKD
jgi:hypothetical protein